MLKSVFLSCLFLFLYSFSSAQEISHFAVGGNLLSYKSTGYSVDLSLAENAIITLNNEEAQVTQGYLQPSDIRSANISYLTNEICLGDTVILSAQNGLFYEWRSIEELNNVISTDSFVVVSPTKTTTFELLFNKHYTKTETVKIKPIQACPLRLNIYELVSPNDDEDNSYFIIENIDLVARHEVFVFDKWGKQVFFSNQYANNWTAEELTDGIYIYLIKDQDRDITYKGKLLIKR